MNWIEAAGYAGTGFTILSYSMRGMLALRIAAVLSSASFLAYAGLIGSYPLLVMEVILLPINSYRLLELLRSPRGDVAHPVVEAQHSFDAGEDGLGAVAYRADPAIPGK